jgi:hypothetical protein
MPTSGNSTARLTVNVHVWIQFDPELNDSLRLLIGELVGLAELGSATMLLDVCLLADDLIGPTVNRFKGLEVYPAGDYVPLAVAVPNAADDGLHCLILIGESHILGYTHLQRPDTLITSLLEELLHARLYYLRWSEHGQLGGLPDFETETTRIIAERIHDEYVVCRLKALHASREPLFDTPGMPGYRSTRILSYGDNVANVVTTGLRDIEALRGAWKRDELTYNQLTQALHRVVFRGFLDPLARSHAFYEGMPEAERCHYPIEQLQEPLYVERIEPYWEQIHSQLRSSFDFDLLSMDRAIEQVDFAVQRLTRNLDGYIRFSEDQ